MKEIVIKLGRNIKSGIVTYDKKGRAIVSVKTTSGKRRSWKVKPE